MATSTKKATELKISPIGDFKKRLGGITELPSGLVVRLHNPGGLSAFLDNGAIPNSLMTVVTKHLKEDQAGVDEEGIMDEATTNPEFLEQMTKMMDSIAMKTIVEPVVNPLPGEGEKRSDELLYVDEIPFGDKQFIFEWITSGVKALEPFRK